MGCCNGCLKNCDCLKSCVEKKKNYNDEYYKYYNHGQYLENEYLYHNQQKKNLLLKKEQYKTYYHYLEDVGLSEEEKIKEILNVREKYNLSGYDYCFVIDGNDKKTYVFIKGELTEEIVGSKFWRLNVNCLSGFRLKELEYENVFLIEGAEESASIACTANNKLVSYDTKSDKEKSIQLDISFPKFKSLINDINNDYRNLDKIKKKMNNNEIENKEGQELSLN